MASGTIELAPPNEGGDDRDANVLRQRLDEIVTAEYPALDEEALERLLRSEGSRGSGGDGDAEPEEPRRPVEIPAQRVPTHDMVNGQKEKDARVPEPIEFTESLVGERGLSRRYRQRALGIHAGYLMVRRQHLIPVRRRPDDGIEYRLG